MVKKILQFSIVLVLIFGLLFIASKAISNYRLNKYDNSVVNDETFDYKNIEDIFKKTNNQIIYVFLYDSDSDDCIYLDEVLLKEISYNHNGLIFQDIYKVIYEQSYRSFISQMIKNTYQIKSFPAIVAIQKTTDGFEKLDSFEYTTDQKENLKNLNAFLERNHFFEISQKD